MRRIRAMARETAEARLAAEEKRERDKLEPAYMAKSAAELFELRQARAEGATPEEARARAKRAGELAFQSATVDVDAARAQEEAFEARQAARRAQVAAQAAQEASGASER